MKKHMIMGQLSLVLLTLISFGNISFSQTLNLTTGGQFVLVGDLDVAGNQITVETLVKKVGGVNVLSKHTDPSNVNYLLRMGTFELTTSTQFHLMLNPYAGSMLSNNWYHIAGTYDGSFIRYYVNGCLIVEEAASGNMAQNNLITAIGNISTAPFAEQFIGELDEMRIWSVARTAAQLSANMFDLPNPTTEPNLKAYYKFNGDLINSQGNATHNGTWVGTPSYGTQPLASVIPPFDVQSITPTPASCFGAADGKIDVLATGTNLKYSLDGVTWQASSQFTGLIAGTYSVSVRTPEGCIINDATIQVTEPIQVTATASNNGPYCAGDLIEIVGSSTSAGTLTYQWTGPGGFTSTDQNPTNATQAGTYTLVVSNSTLCSSPPQTTILVVNPVPVVQSITPTPASCFGAADGKIVVLATGTGLKYSLDGITWQNSNEFTGLIAGTYAVYVQSTGGCVIAPTAVVVTEAAEVNAVATNNGPYCAGDLIELLGSSSSAGTLTYQWTGPGGFTSTDQNPTNATQGGTYTLVVSNSTLCSSAPQTTTLIVNSLPVVQSITPTPASCFGDSDGKIVVLATGTDLEYSLDGITWQASNEYTGLIAGTYTVFVRSTGDCDVSDATIVVTEPIEVNATASNNGPYCAGGLIELIGSSTSAGTLTYQWTGPGGFTSTAQNPTTATQGGTYTLIVSNTTLCSSPPQTTSLIISTLPDVQSITPTAASCFGASDGEITVLANGTGLSYSLDGITFQASNQFTGLVAGTYSVTVKTTDGCMLNDATIVVTEPAEVNATASNNGPFCVGGSIQLSGSSTSAGTLTYQWTGPGGFTSSDQNPTNATLTGTYSLIVTNASLCNSPAQTTNLVVNPLPVVQSITPTAASCFGAADGVILVLATGNNLTYSLDGITWQASNQLTGLVAGTYSISVRTAEGCIVTNATVVVSEPAQVTAAASNGGPYCVGDLTQLLGSSTATGTLTYQWTGPGGFTSTVQNPTTATVAGNYSLIVTNSDLCSSTAQTTNLIIVPSSPLIIAKTDPLCFGDVNGTATVSTTAPGVHTYQWSPFGGNAATATGLSPGTYTVEVSNQAGCISTSTITLDNPLQLDMTLTSTLVNCGSKDGTATATVSGGTGAYTYLWSPDNQTDNSISNLSVGNYSLTVTDGNACTATSSVLVGQNGSLNMSVNPAAASIYEDESIDLNVTFTPFLPGVTYTWTPTNGLSCTDCPNPTATPVVSTDYVVTITTPDGCVDEETISISTKIRCGEHLIPSVFSPNGDGINDVFDVFGLCIVGIHMQVYSRWGELVFETEKLSEGWDGTYKGERMNTGSYVYQIKLTFSDGEFVTETGNVNLIR